VDGVAYVARMTMGESGVMHGWVWRENLVPFLTMTADLARYELDQSDVDAVMAGVSQSSAEEDDEHWFTHAFGSDPHVQLGFAQSRDGDEVLIDAEFDERGERFADRVALLMDVFSRYRVTGD
jgi:hypothetical protein